MGLFPLSAFPSEKMCETMGKVSPFYNSWNDPNADEFLSDVRIYKMETGSWGLAVRISVQQCWKRPTQNNIPSLSESSMCRGSFQKLIKLITGESFLSPVSFYANVCT